MGYFGQRDVTGLLAILVGGSTTAPLAVAASNVSRTQGGSGLEGDVTTTASPNTTITGGVTPRTQAWTRIIGSSAFISDANALNPTWNATVSVDFPVVETWRVTVTDAVSAVTTFDITITLRWVNTDD